MSTRSSDRPPVIRSSRGGNLVPGDAGSIDALQNQLKALQNHLKDRDDKIADYRNRILAYRCVNNDRANEAQGLEEENKRLRSQLATLSQESGWKVPGFLGRSNSGLQNDHRLAAKEAEYKARIHELEKELENQHNELQKQNEEFHKRLNMQSQSFARELEEIKAKNPFQITTQKVTDNEIQSKWKSLRFLVRQFVENHLPASIEWDNAKSPSLIDFLPLRLKYQLTSGMLCPTILESYIWHFLYFKFFEPEASHWGGETGQSFANACRKLFTGIHEKYSDSVTYEANVEKFHDWRARSVEYIHRMLDQGCKGPAVVAELLESMAQLIVLQGGDFSNSSIHEAVQDIVSTADELDCILRSSKAHFTIFITRVHQPLYPPCFGFEFDHASMEYTTKVPLSISGMLSNGPSVVELVVAPGLIKSGTADGKRYGNELILSKLQVLGSQQIAFGVPVTSEMLQVPETPSGRRKRSRKPSIVRETSDIKEEALDEVVMVDVKGEPGVEDTEMVSSGPIYHGM